MQVLFSYFTTLNTFIIIALLLNLGIIANADDYNPEIHPTDVTSIVEDLESL